MKFMPKKIKDEVRKFYKLSLKFGETSNKIYSMLEDYGLDGDDFNATGSGEVQTEALAYIGNGEIQDIEKTIDEMEEVFLYYINNTKS